MVLLLAEEPEQACPRQPPASAVAYCSAPASRSLSNSVAMRDVQDYAGHKDPRTTAL